MNKEGKEERDSNKIAYNYLFTSRFLFDFLAVLGSNIFDEFGEVFQFFGLFKMIRVRRLSTYLDGLNLAKDIKAFLSILKLTFYLVLWLHIQACIW